MTFDDRAQAGRELAGALKAESIGREAVVVALPRGGVVLGRVVADALDLPLDIVVPRKIAAPWDPEYAVGAIAEGGTPIWNEAETSQIDPEVLAAEVGKEKAEAERRLRTYRGGLPPRDLRGKTVIVVDDGVATGLTMRAALVTVRAEKPRRVIVAVPVSPPDSAALLRREVDALVVLDTPALFGAIGAFYRDFPQVDDATVIALLHPKS